MVNKIVQTFDLKGRMLALSVYAVYLEQQNNGGGKDAKTISGIIQYNEKIVSYIINWIKENESKELSIPVNYNKNNIHKKIEDVFLEHSSLSYNFAKERKFIKDFVQRVYSIPGITDYDKAIELILKTFHDLHASGEKFWAAQPFLPSLLMRDFAWTRIMTIVENKMKSEHKAAALTEGLEEVYG